MDSIGLRVACGGAWTGRSQTLVWCIPHKCDKFTGTLIVAYACWFEKRKLQCVSLNSSLARICWISVRLVLMETHLSLETISGSESNGRIWLTYTKPVQLIYRMCFPALVLNPITKLHFHCILCLFTILNTRGFILIPHAATLLAVGETNMCHSSEEMNYLHKRPTTQPKGF